MDPSAAKWLNSPNPSTVYILDIDSTLVSTHQRNQAILVDYCLQYRNLFPEDCELIRKVECRPGDYGFKTGVERLGIQIEDLKGAAELRRFWREHFFSNTYLGEDRPNPCAVNWVQGLHRGGVPFYYLTARPHQRMWEGTLKTMGEMGFPIQADILFLKQNEQEPDEHYKVTLLKDLKDKVRPQSEIVFVDNEPVVLNAIESAHPDVHLIWYDSTHSGRMSPPQKSYRINHFCVGTGNPAQD